MFLCLSASHAVLINLVRLFRDGRKRAARRRSTDEKKRNAGRGETKGEAGRYKWRGDLISIRRRIVRSRRGILRSLMNLCSRIRSVENGPREEREKEREKERERGSFPISRAGESGRSSGSCVP